MTDPNQPAFPVLHIRHFTGQDADGMHENVVPRYMGGMTKREEFAKAAMIGIIANQKTASMNPTFEDVAVHAVLQADALIKELNKEPKP